MPDRIFYLHVRWLSARRREIPFGSERRNG